MKKSEEKQEVSVSFKEAELRFIDGVILNNFKPVHNETGRFTSKIPTYGPVEDFLRVILVKIKE